MLSSKRSFKSDNYSGVHPAVLKLIADINQGHAVAYTEDDLSQEVAELIQKTFNQSCAVAYTLNGTGANVLSLRLCLRAGESVLLADSAHLNVNETGAPEAIVGCKLLPVPTNQLAKITPQQILSRYHSEKLNSYHATLPKVLSISETTEYGTVYTISELQALRKVCDQLDLFFHIDACRVYNAAEFLNVGLDEIISASGADLISLGGTKNGAMIAEAVLIFNQRLQSNYKYLQKNTLQLYSKNRYLAAQFKALLQDNLWLQNAKQANSLARMLAQSLSKYSQLKIIYPVESNMLFVETSEKIATHLENKGLCYIWRVNPWVIRLVISYDNTEGDVVEFLEMLESVLP